MAVVSIYAGTSSTLTTADKLPSPVSIKQSNEQIWSQNTGRAQSGANQAKMIGESIAEKKTYEIQWGIITYAQFTEIRTKMPQGFFYFGLSTSAPIQNASKYYRGTITGEMISIGDGTTRYKNVTVTVIEQ